MSQDNDNKTGNPDFDTNAGTPFNDDHFDPFSDADFSFGSEESLSESASFSEQSTESASQDSFGDLPGPSSFLTGESMSESMSDSMSVSEEMSGLADLSKIEDVETDAKGKKKKNKKEKKPKAEKKKKEKKSKEPGEKEPAGIGGTLCLVFGFLLLLGLVVSNVLLLMTDAKDLGIGASSVIFYLIGMDVIGLIGVVSVPFLFFLYRKDIDVYKVGLGVSAMAMSLGVIFLLTALFRYDFVIEAPKASPSTDIPVSAAPAVPEAE